MGSKDDEHGNFPEIVDALTQHGAATKVDARALSNTGCVWLLPREFGHHALREPMQ